MKCFILLATIFLCLSINIEAQSPTQSNTNPGGGMAISPARVELEMKPGTETTIVVNLDYHSAGGATQPARIVASLNDWTINKQGGVDFFRANSQPNSASSWLIYSPGEAAVLPAAVHQIRVTISVPADATPGDHLAALIIEQRPETLKAETNARQMIIRYRMASVFYIKVPGLTKRGDFGNLYAESTPDGIVVTPTFRNEGNSVIRPMGSVTIVDAGGKVVAELPSFEQFPVLAGAEMSKPVLIERSLPPGNYSVKFKVDFQDGGKTVEGVTDLVVKAPPQAAKTSSPTPKP